MTLLAETTDIMVREHQVRITETEATAALERVMGSLAVEARARLRFGPGRTCEQLARVLDKALAQAQAQAQGGGLAADTLVLNAGGAVAAEDIVRMRRKAHGVADWISSPTSHVTIVLRPKGLVAAASAALPAPAKEPVVPPARQSDPETEAELEVREALYEVIDPDLGVNIVDLGFVRQIHIDAEGLAAITMTLTSAVCPLTLVMERNIGKVLAGTGTKFELQWEWLPSWRPRDISDDGREQLQALGFTAF
jgi:metal-sulfur cluster biosynthetic enzyme/ribosomal protein L22